MLCCATIVFYCFNVIKDYRIQIIHCTIILLNCAIITTFYFLNDNTGITTLYCTITMLSLTRKYFIVTLPCWILTLVHCTLPCLCVFCHATTVPHCGITILLCVIPILNYNNKILNYDIIAFPLCDWNAQLWHLSDLLWYHKTYITILSWDIMMLRQHIT